MKTRLVAGGAALALAAGVIAGPASHAADSSAGTSETTTRVLEVELGSGGSLLGLSLVGEEGAATTTGAASALARLRTFDITSGAVSALNINGPVVEATSAGTKSVTPPPVDLSAPAGLVSLLVRNGDALAMRPGLSGDWAACAEAFGSDRYENRIGLSARADRLADLTGRLAGHGLRVTAWYGVRVFTDTAAGDAEPPPDLAALLDCEERAGRTDPYRQVAALLHVIARKEVEPCG